jgi:hypothetical protein
MELNFYFDDKGDPRVGSDEEGALLGQYLESDIQGSQAIGTQILEKMHDVGDNLIESWEFTGNAHTLSFNCSEACITPLFNDSQEPLTLPLFQLELILNNWMNFLSKK